MNILKLVASARRSGTTIFRRNGHGHEVHTPIGPPVTMDSMPVPFQSYHQVHRDLQSKFNTYLAGSFAFFVLTLAYGCYEDVFIFESMRTPESYRNRNKQ
ncbi:Hypothetical protein SRAE_1000265900 [Strongyloides ratti]|uniref:Deltameth_res domain-containing protein n=1 Tax=Strongyloides ratti TaxID=34506 RepID=A0A090LA62_STRRB|nr:Hypothetical protein SRAE_1000265900 [Strongyloides ratti]CEF64405.1 Hypothetical protein SRAE_1000265900 [Strongyloides ratti]